MGAIYTEAQKEATRRYVNSTDQIRVRTDKGNLDFIKAEILIETAHSDEYDISGKLLLAKDDHYEIDYIVEGVRKIKKLDKQKDVPSGFVSDYAWMSLENEYENDLLGGE